MRKFGLVLGAGGIAMVAACSDGAVTSSNGSVTVNTTVIGADVQNGLEATGNMARNGARSLGNGMSRAGDVIENNAKAAWNEVKDATRELRGGEGNTSTNSAGN